MMKKTYVPMTVECEVFEMNQAVAAGCIKYLVTTTGDSVKCDSCNQRDDKAGHRWALYADTEKYSFQMPLYAVSINNVGNGDHANLAVEPGFIFEGKLAGGMLQNGKLSSFRLMNSFQNVGIMEGNTAVPLVDDTIVYNQNS